MSIAKFSLYRPKSLDDALEFLSNNAGLVKPLAGGTELLLLIRDKKIPTPKYLLDLNAIRKELSYVKLEEDKVRIGATTTLYELSQSILHKDKRYAGFADVFYGFATMAMRFYATIGGNILSATQYNDYLTLLTVYEPELVLVSKEGERRLTLEQLVLDKRKLAIRPNELLKEIIIPVPPENTSSSFIKFDRRRILIAGVVTGAVLLTLNDNMIEDIKISFDMIREKRVPGRAKKTEEFLRGKELSEEVVEEAAEEILPSEMERVSDWWTTAEYRLDMSKVVLKRNIFRAARRIRGEK
ncbi:MAG: FAD binding domain-containing protein [Desulfurococcales archaeon]|nr:FAD binding domain-containing protein [Desulfurococcales archaeon]